MGIGDSIGKAAENAMEDLAGTSSPAEKESDAGDVPRDVPGPAGLPDGDPDALRADPGEGDEDPSTELGRS